MSTCTKHIMIISFLFSFYFAGQHGTFKILTQEDDFDDDLGVPLEIPNDSDSDSDMRNQFDEGKGAKCKCLPLQFMVHW